MMFRYSLLLLFTCLSSTIFAQLYCPPVHGKQGDKSFHISAGAGLTYLKGDINKPNTAGRAAFVRFDYTIMKGIDLGLEGQFGTLEAIGDITDSREVKNKYRGGGIVATIYPFKLVSEKQYTSPSFGKTLKESFYIGVGILGIVNNYDSIYRDPNMPATYGPIAYYDDDDEPVFKERINSVTLPTLNVGFAVPINKQYSSNGRYWSILLNGQFNFANNDLLDGYMPYDANFDRIGTKNDMYSFYSLGLRYSL